MTQPIHLALLLLLVSAALVASWLPGTPRTVGVCWKPYSRATLQDEVQNMSALLSATELIVYCGLGAQTNGSFGVVTAAHSSRWGQPELCLPALAAARNGGIKSIQVMVESRTDMPAFDPALKRGGRAFGTDMFALLGSRYPDVDGVTFDFERGEDKSTPVPTPQQFAEFLGGVVGVSPQKRDGSARYAVDVSMDSKGCPYLSTFSPLLQVGVRRVRDMGLYHAPNSTEWRSTLAAGSGAALCASGGTGGPPNFTDLFAGDLTAARNPAGQEELSLSTGAVFSTHGAPG